MAKAHQSLRNKKSPIKIMSKPTSKPLEQNENRLTVGKGCCSFLLGPAMLLGAIYMIFWNEGNYIKTAHALDELRPLVQHVEDTATPSPELEGKPVHIQGTATTPDILRDESYGIEANAISLSRSVEFLQWEEDKKQRPANDTKPRTMSGSDYHYSRDENWVYSYHRRWVKRPIISSSFYDVRYRNLNCVYYQENNHNFLAQNVFIGGYTLHEGQIKRISATRAVVNPAQVPLALQSRAALNGKYLHIGRGREGNTYYLVNPQEPAVGDARISWSIIGPSQPVSLIAVQRGNSFVPYTASNGISIDLLYTDTLSAEQCLDEADSANLLTLWMLRMGGWLIMWGGFGCMLIPLANLTPVCHKLAQGGDIVISLLLGTMLSLLVMAIAWFFYRPILAASLLAALCGLTWLLIKKNFKKA